MRLREVSGVRPLAPRPDEVPSPRKATRFRNVIGPQSESSTAVEESAFWAIPACQVLQVGSETGIDMAGARADFPRPRLCVRRRLRAHFYWRRILQAGGKYGL